MMWDFYSNKKGNLEENYIKYWPAVSLGYCEISKPWKGIFPKQYHGMRPILPAILWGTKYKYSKSGLLKHVNLITLRASAI